MPKTFGFGAGILSPYPANFGLLNNNTISVGADGRFDLQLFWEAWDQLRANFFGRQDIDAEKALYGAFSSLVKSLDDPYTNFLDPQDSKRFLEDVSGEFEGVGMEIGSRNGQLQVIAPLADTPADKAGIKAGDRILQINDKPTAELSVDEAVNLIRGPQGSQVTLILLRKDETESRKVSITRERIKIPGVKWELKDGFAHVKLSQFSQTADAEFRKAALEILASPAQGVIGDLCKKT